MHSMTESGRTTPEDAIKVSTTLRTREPLEQGEPWEFITNFLTVLDEHGLDHAYHVDDFRRRGWELSDQMSYTRHTIYQLGKKRVLGRGLWTTRRPIANILSESQRDPGPSIFMRIPRNGLIIQVLNSEDTQIVDSVVNGLREFYPDEPVTVLKK